MIAPTMISGAVSPTARESARIEPVAIPGIAAGSTCRQTTCHFVAPSANAPCRMESGTARMASLDDTTTVGRTTECQDQAARKDDPSDADAAHDESESENPVDDGRDRGEILDVDLDGAVPPPLAIRVLLEVDRGAHRPEPRRARPEHPDRASRVWPGGRLLPRGA